uniref:Uncharacterized protein n=1 Tax=Romanomermis culicivorax TaxID=13658 RepID=A0A915HF48_ROMCU
MNTESVTNFGAHDATTAVIASPGLTPKIWTFQEPTKRYLLMTTTAPEPPTQIVPPPQPTVQIEEPDLQKTASGSDVRFASNATEKVAPPAPKSTVFSFIDRPKKPKASVFSIIPAKKNQDTVFDEIERRRDGTSKKSYHLKKSCRILIFVFAILIIGAIIFSIYFGITKFAPRTTPSDSIIVSTALSNVKNVSNYQDPKTTNHLFVVNSRTTIAKAISTIGKTTNKAKN